MIEDKNVIKIQQEEQDGQELEQTLGELQVEHYDASEVEAKRKKILKIVAVGVGIAALSTMLGCFGLKKASKTEPVEYEPMNEFLLGGNGAWFNSIIQFTG